MFKIKSIFNNNNIANNINNIRPKMENQTYNNEIFSRTTKYKEFNYYSEENELKNADVIKITDKSYMSNLIYKSLLSEKESLELNSIFESYKGNSKEMRRYGCDVNDIEIFNRQINIFKNINKTVDISKLIKVKYSNINNIYIMVNENYRNKEIEVD